MWFVLRTVKALYIILTLPLLGLLVHCSDYQHETLKYFTHYVNKFYPPLIALVGDSHTAGGGAWSFRIGYNPFSAVVCGVRGAKTDELQEMVIYAKQSHPKYLHLLVGTNDVLAKIEPEVFKGKYADLLRQLKSSESNLIVTLIPMLKDSNNSPKVTAFNEKIIELKEQFDFQVIDLNPILAPRGVLLSEFTTDGVHLSELAYEKWGALIKEKITQ